MKRKNYQALFFDADDTLFDYAAAEKTALQACLKHFRIRLPLPEVLSVYRRHNHDVWKALEKGKIDPLALRSERFLRTFAEFGRRRVLAEAFSEMYLEEIARCHDLIPGALDTIRHVSLHYPLALITNGIAYVQRRRLAASPLTKYFSVIVISEEAGFIKPDPGILQPAFQVLETPKNRVLFIGDSITSDMDCARRANIDFCWYNPQHLPPPLDYSPRFIINNLAELIPLLTKATGKKT